MQRKKTRTVAIVVSRAVLLASFTFWFWAAVRVAFPAALVAAGEPVRYVKTYANFVRHTTQQKDVTVQGVQATSDGGTILLASTSCTTNDCVMAQGNTNPVINWLIKTDSSGNPQWEKELGCFKAAPGDYTIGVSLQQTADGGYVVGGGALNESASCGTAGNEQRAIVEKLDSQGNLTWSKTYSIGPNADGITAIRPAADGGFVAVGGVYESGPSPGGGLVLKMDASGSVQWQTIVGPMGSATASLLATQQTSDGGYVASGSYFVSSPNCGPLQCVGGLVIKLDASGKVQWQHALSPGSSGSLFTDSILQTSDGGYVAAGAWFGSAQKGGLLVKLDPSGTIVWQNAYSDGSYFGEELGKVFYSVRETSDGGYFLVGDGEAVVQGEVSLVPWLGKVDSSGNPQWQNFYYQVNPSTGLPLSEYFAGGDVAKDGGFVASGWTEDYANGLGLLFVVKTDAVGLCGNCSDVHPDTRLSTVNPDLISSPVLPPVRTAAISGSSSPIDSTPTAIMILTDCFSGMADTGPNGDGMSHSSEDIDGGPRH